ncbi:MAG: hypothetical protein ACM3ML_37600 [Micromonosporaceae bacterium]
MIKATPRIWYSLVTAAVLGVGGLASALPAQGSAVVPQGQHQASTQARAANPDRAVFTKALVTDLRKSGFQVNPGYPMVLGPDSCKAYTYPLLKDCFGNNPAGGYANAVVKAWPHEQVGPTPPDVLGQVDPGYTPIYRLGTRDALVFYGQMPPPGRYMGWQTFLWSQPGRWKAKDYNRVASIPNRPWPLQYRFHTIPPNDPNANRVFSQSSVGDIVNNVVMQRKSGDSWGKNRYFITTPSATTDQAVRSALHALGVPDSDIFTEQIPSRDAYGPIGPLGMGKNAIDFWSTFRYAIPDNQAAAKQWWQTLPLTVLRVRAPSSLGPVHRYGMLTYEKQTTPHPEAYLKGDMQDLVNAVCQRTSSVLGLKSADCTQPPPASSFMVNQYTDYGWTGPYCRSIHMWCGDQNDIGAGTTTPRPLDSGQVYAVVDTLATETGNATYVGLGVNDASTFFAPTGVNDLQLKGSADQYAATVNNAGKFFVHYFTRNCDTAQMKALVGENRLSEDCTSITEDMVPPKWKTTALGDPALHGMFFPILRDYIAPGTARGPDQSKLLTGRVLSFTKP